MESLTLVPAAASNSNQSEGNVEKKQQQALLPEVQESPFFPVATEMLNWAIVYNCRRHELLVPELLGLLIISISGNISDTV